MEDKPIDKVKKAIFGDELASVTDGVRPGMLDLRPRKGQWLALPYTAIREVSYNPSSKPPLRIEFSSYIIEIEGTQLKGVYLSIVGMRAVTLTEVQSMHRIGDESDEKAVPNIDRITIKQKKARPAQGDAG